MRLSRFRPFRLLIWQAANRPGPAYRVCDQNRTRARARHLAKLNTKGFSTKVSGGEID